MTDPLTNTLVSPAAGAATVVSPDRAAENAHRAAVEFEAVYLSIMLSSMFTDLNADGPLGGGQGEKLFRSQLYEELGQIIARSGGVGVADAVYREMMRHQEV